MHVLKRRYTLYQDDIWPPFPRERDRNPLPFRVPLVLSMFFLSLNLVYPALRLSTRAFFLGRWSRVCGWRICEKQKKRVPLARQTSSSSYIFAYISKNRLGWIPIVFVYIACIGSYQAAKGPPFSSQHLYAMFDSISDLSET